MGSRRFALWDSTLPFPSREGLSYPEGARDEMVHRAASDGYDFLHDPAIVEHRGTLYAAWYNCPQGEMQGSSLIRGRRSKDGGRTWSGIEVIAADTQGKGVMYVPVAFLSHRDTLYAYVSNMVGADLVTGCEVFVLDETENSWTSRGFIAGPFLPNCAPQGMADGSFVMPGRMADRPARKPRIPAVAISNGDQLTAEWGVVPLLPAGTLPDGSEMRFPETTVFVEANEITALVRNDSGNSLLFRSDDYGRTWSEPYEHNFPMGAAKICAGTLSTGQRYLLSNTPTEGYRDLLTIAVGRPGEKTFCRMWALRDRYSEALKAGPEWSYPCAAESNGKLFVVYTSEKRHCVLTILPVESLAAA